MKTIQIFLFAVCLLGGIFFASAIQEQEAVESKRPAPKRPVTRAKRPTFEKKDWGGIFFEDIFSEGLSGNRPEKNDGSATQVAGQAPGTGTTNPGESDAAGWAQLIDGFVLENEVKRWQQELAGQVTTPIKFKTTHNEISERFSMLAMWFAVIGQYENDVRWKDESASARVAFMDAASKSRKNDIASFNNVRQKSEDLAELIRGGKFPEEPDAKLQFSDWSSVVDRNPIMNRLEFSVSEELKQATASESDFKDNVDLIVHEASLIAVMGRVLHSPEMLDADDDDYHAFAKEMLDAALAMKVAANEKSLDRVNDSLNRINQACTNCHGDFKF